MPMLPEGVFGFLIRGAGYLDLLHAFRTEDVHAAAPKLIADGSRKVDRQG